MDKEENQSPSVLKLRTIELENKLLIEKQRYILLQSELESAMSISSKHLDIYKNECMDLKEKLNTLENDYNQLKNKEQKHEETIKNLLKKIERVDKECGSEIQKKQENLKKNDKEVEEDAYDYAVENEGENTRVFVDLDSDSHDGDDAMKRGSESDSDDSLIMINSECKTPRKKFKSASDSTLFNDGVSDRDNHAESGTSHTQSPGKTKIDSVRKGYIGRIPSSKQKDGALERAEQLQKNIRNPSCIRTMTLSGSYWLTLSRKFCKDNHLPDNDTEMILESKDGAKYEVNYISRRNAFSRGWAKFARVFCLETGDVLVFELMNSTRFKVHILKAIQED